MSEDLTLNYRLLKPKGIYPLTLMLKWELNHDTRKEFQALAKKCADYDISVSFRIYSEIKGIPISKTNWSSYTGSSIGEHTFDLALNRLSEATKVGDRPKKCESLKVTKTKLLPAIRLNVLSGENPTTRAYTLPVLRKGYRKKDLDKVHDAVSLMYHDVCQKLKDKREQIKERVDKIVDVNLVDGDGCE